MDTCIFCLKKVDENKWREHMDLVHHAVNSPDYQLAVMELNRQNAQSNMNFVSPFDRQMMKNSIRVMNRD